MSAAKPLPKRDTTNGPFWDGAREGKLMLQVCRACGDTRFPPSHVCPRCLSADQAWEQASGEGTIESWIDMHRAYWDGFKGDLPYRVVLVRLAEGPVVMSNLTDNTDNLRMGQPVRAVFETVAEGVVLPKFALA